MSDETSRYFPNPFIISDARAADRALPSNTFIKSLVEELLDQRKVSDHSVYTGRLGVDILRLRYTGSVDHFHAKNVFKHNESFFTGYAGYLALKIAANTEPLNTQALNTSNSTSSNNSNTNSIINSNSNTNASSSNLISRIKKLLQIANSRPRNGWECEELLYGRSGWLAAIGFSLNYRPDILPIIKETLIVQLYSLFISGTKQNNGKLHYTWHGKNYLGWAHGISGILQTFLGFKKYWTEIEFLGKLPENTILNHILATVEDILENYTFESGNIHSSAGSKSDRLVHWCHGAPGWIITLLMLGKITEDVKLVSEAEKLGDIVWNRGLLKKGVGLCHGISGNGYCFLQLYQFTGDEKWLNAAKYFAGFAVKKLAELIDIPDRPDSLFEGRIGLALLLLDLKNPREARFPCMEFVNI